jgi:hypothetical protein
MTKNFTYLILIVLIVLTVLFIRPAEIEHSSQAEDELKIVDSVHLIGATPNVNGTDIQLYSYNYTLYNGGDEKVYIDAFEPLFKTDFLARVLTKEHKIFVNKTIEPNTSILIRGQVEIDSSNLTKEQIFGFGPYVYGVNITSTRTVVYSK